MAVVALLLASAPEEFTPVPVDASTPQAGLFRAVEPTRILDTREGSGDPLAPNGSVDLDVIGDSDVPPDALAVVLNLTVTEPAAAGHLVVYPTGSTMPATSTLNFLASQTVPNLAEVKLGNGGAVTVTSGSAGAVHVVADVFGYVTAGADGPAGRFNPLVPDRLIDTRPSMAVGPEGDLEVVVTGRGGVPAQGVSAVALNVVETEPTHSGHLTVDDGEGAVPLSSNVNFVPGLTSANRVIAGVGEDGAIRIHHGGAGTVHVVVDVNGWFTDATGSGGAAFVPLEPIRVADSRTGGAFPRVTATPVSLPVGGQDPIPTVDAGLVAVVTNLTSTNHPVPTHITAWPSGAAMPPTSDLNVIPGVDRANFSITRVGFDGAVAFINAYGETDLVVDVFGYYVAISDATATAGEVPDTTVVQPPEAVLEISQEQNGWPSQVRLDTAKLLAPLEVGDTLVAGIGPATPLGLWGKITGIVVDGSVTIVTLEPTTLAETLGDGSGFSIHEEPGEDAELRVSPTSTVRVQRAASNSVTLPGGIECTGPGYTLDGGFTFDLGFDFNAVFGNGITTSLVQSAEVSATATAGFDASATLQAQVSCAVDETLGAPIRFAPIVFTIGFVPVVIVPELKFVLKANAEAGFETGFGVNEEVSLRAGLRWDGGGITPINELTETHSVTAPSLSDVENATATASASVGPELTFLLYGVAGPGVGASVGGQAALAPSDRPPCTVDGVIESHASLKLSILGEDIIDVTQPLASLSKRFYECQAVSASPDTATLRNRETVRITGTMTGSSNTGQPLEFSVSGGGSVSPASAVTDANGNAYVNYTAPQSGEGDATITVRKPGSSAASLRDTSTVHYTPSPPAPCIDTAQGWASASTRQQNSDVAERRQAPSGAGAWHLEAHATQSRITADSAQEVAIDCLGTTLRAIDVDEQIVVDVPESDVIDPLNLGGDARDHAFTPSVQRTDFTFTIPPGPDRTVRIHGSADVDLDIGGNGINLCRGTCYTFQPQVVFVRHFGAGVTAFDQTFTLAPGTYMYVNQVALLFSYFTSYQPTPHMRRDAIVDVNLDFS